MVNNSFGVASQQSKSKRKVYLSLLARVSSFTIVQFYVPLHIFLNNYQRLSQHCDLFHEAVVRNVERFLIILFFLFNYQEHGCVCVCVCLEEIFKLNNLNHWNPLEAFFLSALCCLCCESLIEYGKN